MEGINGGIIKCLFNIPLVDSMQNTWNIPFAGRVFLHKDHFLLEPIAIQRSYREQMDHLFRVDFEQVVQCIVYKRGLIKSLRVTVSHLNEKDQSFFYFDEEDEVDQQNCFQDDEEIIGLDGNIEDKRGEMANKNDHNYRTAIEMAQQNNYNS